MNIQIYRNFSHLPTDGHLGYLLITLLWNLGPSYHVNICFHFFWNKIYLEVELLDGNSMFNFLMNSQTVFHSSCTIMYYHQQFMKVPVLHILSSTCYVTFSWLNSPNGCEMVSHCGFDLHFLNDRQWWIPFFVPVGNL